ncbi:MAG: hypothetical protein Q8O62_13100 [Aequorivita sp.]|nr:hypothetical protein [Aequorivita sp.]
MPKIKSIIKIVGTIKGMTYYFLNGEYVARRSNPPTKDQIYNDPRFASVRANTKEFGGASILSKAIRNGLGENEKMFKDIRFASRLSGVCRKIIQKGNGKMGEREANLSNMPEALKGFQLHKTQIFNRIFPATPTVTTDQYKQLITISIPKVIVIPPKGKSRATHFKLIAAISTVSSHKWHRKTQKYRPTNAKSNGLGATATTASLCCNQEYPNIQLVLTNPIKPNPFPFPKFNFFPWRFSNQTAITVWLGITFLSIAGQTYSVQKKHRAMECIAVL